MPFLSSIFSFETWRGGLPRPGAAVGLAAGVLLLFDVGVARRETLWKYDPVVRFRGEMEARVIAPAPAPLVVLFGSSTTKDAVAPRILEGELGLPQGSVINLGIPFGTSYDALFLYRRHRERLSKAKLLILGLDECCLDAHHTFQAHAPYCAPLQDRLDYFEDPGTLLGWAWRTCDFGPAAAWTAETLFRTLIHKEKAGIPFAFTPDGRFSPTYLSDKAGPGNLSHEVRAKAGWDHFVLSRKRARVLKDFAALARSDGIQVLFLQIPGRDRYVDWVEARYPETRRASREALLSLHAPADGVRVRPEFRGSEMGLEETDFADHEHLRTTGARKFTENLGRWLRREYPGLWLQ